MAIDVGSSNVVIAVGSVAEDGRVEILGIVSEPIEGINAGRVVNIETAGRAVRAAKERIEAQLNITITEAYAGLSGDFVRCVPVTDHVYVQDELCNGSNQITQRDVDDLDRRMRSVKLPDDREEIIAMEPLCYTIDDKEVDIPVGAYGHVLAATYNFILCDRSMRDRLRQCLQRQGITIKDFVANAFVSHLSVATTEDVEEGCIVIDLGGGITDVTVLLGGKVRYMASIPIGADSINNDIRTYGIPANYIDSLKIKYGSAMRELAVEDKIVFQAARRGTTKSILRRNLAAIIEARLLEIIEWIKREIKIANCGNSFNPVVLLTGGGAEMQHIEELFAQELRVDEVRTVFPEYGFTENMTQHITTSAQAMVASLLIYGAKHGCCSVAVRQSQVRGETPKTAPMRPIEDTEVHPKQSTPAPEPKREVKIEPKRPTVTPLDDEDDGDIFVTEGDEKRKNWRNKMKNLFDKMSNSFTGNEDELEL